MKKFALIFSIIFLLLVIVAYFIGTNLLVAKHINGILIQIDQGENSRSITNKLYEKGIIRNRLIFYFWVRLTNKATKLDYGQYLFEGKLSMLDVLNIVEKGKIKLEKVTIPEGLTIEKTARILENYKLGNYENFVKICRDSVYARKFTGFHISSLEGFLFPETYHFPKNASEQFIIEHIVKTFFSEISDLDFKPDQKLNFYETIILASIVEKEAVFRSEKPLIAGVYLNRLNSDHLLQADPTVAYILENQGKSRKKIYYKDLKIDSPFNTYKNLGLPPTPICSPSYDSIVAVQEPIDSDFFFFFADGSGGHQFSKYYHEHLKKQKVMKNNGD